ncbi:MAG: FAD-binding oxidoreductase, partial [Verrucomicrobiales bacterium]|nr:FAD-binding oxidoreductase [Verrucomicrobiales bacterium]
DEPETSSKVAAGIVNPITGGRLAASWRVNEMLPFARKFYWDMEEELNLQVFHHTRIARLFRDRDQKSEWLKKSADHAEQFESFLDSAPDFEISGEAFHADSGGFEVKQAGWLDVPVFLQAVQNHLLERLGYAIANFDPSDLEVSDSGVKWKRIESQTVVFCQGWEGNQNPFFDWLPMNPARGEILEISCDHPDAAAEKRIVNRNGWLLALGDGTFRAGSNYDHQFESTEPTPEGRQIVEEKIRGLLRPEFEVTGHRAGIRPIIRQSRAVIGRHPAKERVAFFNGLGSKGVMNGPLLAAQLADHLVHGAPLDEEVDLRRNF